MEELHRAPHHAITWDLALRPKKYGVTAGGIANEKRSAAIRTPLRLPICALAGSRVGRFAHWLAYAAPVRPSECGRTVRTQRYWYLRR
ncbi:MAG: hypothetical protein AAFY53_14870, partial [Pseudomonadota bacterium]